ncbi:MAG: biotin carboxylase N-terminal domain-containing protein [Nocardioidaceae bacterium]|nr:biotin carboxylase N-terminal domain-containing protein [Nocardioidaceae bacterium]
MSAEPDDTREITRVLVANRGEIARRVIATCRRLGIQTVAVFSDPDAHAPHVAEADAAVRLPGSAAAETYLRGDLLVDAARRSGADAVHPGYGFLSEDAGFARAVVAAGLTWVGPRADTIDQMGSKVRAKELMAAAGVPVLAVDPVHAGPDDLPLLVKASAGGGGRGMRVVRAAGDLDAALAEAASEARSAFGDGTVFVEPYLETARHVEVQVVCDEHGTCWVLGDRDCSLQRRHQKVIEEAPAPGVPAELRERLHAAARAACAAVGYVGAGTVEMLVDGDDLFFLEMNTRLQVEHPVTECVTGLDLVALQLAVAEGRPLVGEPPEPSGHAIEVRLYAEDPTDGWSPRTGTVRRLDVPAARTAFDVPPGAGVRVDSGVVPGTRVGVRYDAMLAKVVATAPDRASALRLLVGALRDTRVHGVLTNLDLLLGALADPDVRAGRVHTGLLEERLDAWAAPRVDARVLDDVVLAAALGDAVAAHEASPVQRRVPAAFRNVPSQPRSRGYAVAGRDTVVTARYADVRGRLEPVGTGTVAVHVAAHEVRLERDGVQHVYRLARSGDEVDVDGPHGGVTLRRVPRFEDPAEQVADGSLVSPMPAAVVAVEVAAGDEVTRGQVVVVLEAMKMQHTVAAPHDGVVASLTVAVGDQVESGAVLAVVDEQSTPGGAE